MVFNKMCTNYAGTAKTSDKICQHALTEWLTLKQTGPRHIGVSHNYPKANVLLKWFYLTKNMLIWANMDPILKENNARENLKQSTRITVFINLSFRHKINLVGGWGHVGICCCLFTIVVLTLYISSLFWRLIRDTQLWHQSVQILIYFQLHKHETWLWLLLTY